MSVPITTRISLVAARRSRQTIEAGHYQHVAGRELTERTEEPAAVGRDSGVAVFHGYSYATEKAVSFQRTRFVGKP